MNELFHDINIVWGKIFPIHHSISYYLSILVMLCILLGVLIGLLFMMHKVKERISHQVNKIQLNILNILFGCALILKIIIVCELTKLIIYDHNTIIKSLEHIKPLGYMLGGLIAITGIHVSYIRTKGMEDQHNQNFIETRFNNAITVLGNDSSSARLGGVASFTNLTEHQYKDKKNKEKYLTDNIEILSLHLEYLYNKEIQEFRANEPKENEENENENDIDDSKDSYNQANTDFIDYPKTSNEIIKTLKYINILTKLHKNTNLLHEITIPLKNINIDFDISNLKFMGKIHNVNFKEGIKNIEFNNQITEIILSEKDRTEESTDVDNHQHIKINNRFEYISVGNIKNITFATYGISHLETTTKSYIRNYINSDDIKVLTKFKTKEISLDKRLIVDFELLYNKKSYKNQILCNNVELNDGELNGIELFTIEHKGSLDTFLDDYRKNQQENEKVNNGTTKTQHDNTTSTNDAMSYWKISIRHEQRLRRDLLDLNYVTIGWGNEFMDFDSNVDHPNDITKTLGRNTTANINNMLRIKENDIIIIPSPIESRKVQVCQVVEKANGINIYEPGEYTDGNIGLALKVKNLCGNKWISRDDLEQDSTKWRAGIKTIANIDKLRKEINKWIDKQKEK